MFLIYLIKSTQSNKIYIGYTKDYKTRWKRHLKNCHNQHLKRAMNKYGRETFEFSILEYWTTELEIKQAEEFWIAYFKAIGAELYNQTLGGEHPCIIDAEVKLKMSFRKLGKTHSDETKKMISRSNKITHARLKSQGIIRNTCPIGHRSEEFKTKVSSGLKQFFQNNPPSHKVTKEQIEIQIMAKHSKSQIAKNLNISKQLLNFYIKRLNLSDYFLI
jgi:group I intron endonuclease